MNVYIVKFFFLTYNIINYYTIKSEMGVKGKREKGKGTQF